MSGVPGTVAAAAAPLPRSGVADYVSLAKPRVTSMVVVTTALGYLLAAPRFNPWTLLHAVVGTALVAGGASAFNQVWERDWDALMRRTAGRAVASGRLDVVPALMTASAMSLVGLLDLALAVNALSAALAACSLLLYVLAYTPLKRVTSLATVVGGIPGAIPPMIGWAAGAGTVAPGAIVLFSILFFWQMPHFLAIAWLYREDYGRAGFPMLPVIEPDGASTGRQAVLYAASLLPVSVLLSAFHVSGVVYFWGAVALGVAFTVAATKFAIHRTTASARLLFLSSLVYLPVLLALAFVDRVR